MDRTLSSLVIDVHLAGDHTLYIRTVKHFEARDDKLLLFYAGGYQQLRQDTEARDSISQVRD